MSNTKNWKRAPLEVLNTGPVVPVIVIENIEQEDWQSITSLARSAVAGASK